ncbi:MAG: efflux transporter outer membrane subunit [Gammaproteobacteria bacterium]|nr:efflux transporter outer membrane subunit [Gammaproteobacteria bacterium]
MTPPPRRPLRYAALLCAGLTLNACTTLGPDYQEPEVHWIEDWKTVLHGRPGEPEELSEADLRFWWEVFDDPALNQLIERARSESPTLRIAGLRILESRAQLGIAASTLYPQQQQIGGGIGYIYNKQYGGDLPRDNQSFVGYQAGFNLGWELDFWGRFKRGIESADAAFFASVANQQDAQVLLSAQVADLYYAYRTTQWRIVIAEENAAIQKRSYEITDRVYKSGEKSELDLQQARTQYLATLSTIPSLQITLVQTRNALNALLGHPPGEIPELNGKNDKLPSVEPLLIKDIPAGLLLRRPDLRAAAWQVATQSAQIGIAEADFYPSITLLGSIGWSGNTLSGTPGTGSLAIGPGVTWNVFDYGRITNNVRVQDARLQQLIEQYKSQVIQAAREIDDAAISMVKTAEQQLILDESVDAARRSLDLANARYREGYASFQRVLDAQQSLFSQAERQLVNEGSHIASIIALYKALGGGWLATPIDQLIPEKLGSSMEERTDWGNLLIEPLPDGPARPPTAPEASQHE